MMTEGDQSAKDTVMAPRVTGFDKADGHAFTMCTRLAGWPKSWQERSTRIQNEDPTAKMERIWNGCSDGCGQQAKTELMIFVAPVEKAVARTDLSS